MDEKNEFCGKLCHINLHLYSIQALRGERQRDNSVLMLEKAVETVETENRPIQVWTKSAVYTCSFHNINIIFS